MSTIGARHPPEPASSLDRICVREGQDTLLLPVRSVLYVQRNGRETTIQLDQQTLTVRMSLKRLEGVLHPFGFFRSHKAYLVNLRRIRRIVPWSRHVQNLLLDDPKETMVPLAKARKPALRRALLWPRGGEQPMTIDEHTLLILNASNLSGLA